MAIYNKITEMIGNTPILRLNNYEKKYNVKANLLAKLEYFNPAGSIKDRTAMAMNEDAEKTGTLKSGATIIEPTSGNTGIGIASIGTAKGYRVILTMPETMSVERRNLVKAYGAEVVLTEGSKGMTGAIKRAEELKEEIDGAVILGQFVNEANPRVHYMTTGDDIYDDTNGDIAAFDAGVGTGGTMNGEPLSSPVLSKGIAGSHKIQGIGAGFVPEVLDTSIYDEIIAVPDDDALATGNKIAKSEGILVGISSGAALWAAEELAKRDEFQGKNIVILMPDTGDRYLSTPMFS